MTTKLITEKVLQQQQLAELTIETNKSAHPAHQI